MIEFYKKYWGGGRGDRSRFRYLQACLCRYYIVDIIQNLIYHDCVQNNEEDQGFCKLSVMKWGRVLGIFSVCRFVAS